MAPMPMSRKMETTRPSHSIVRPNTTRLAVTKITGRSPDISARGGNVAADSRMPWIKMMLPRPISAQHSRRGT